MREGLSHPERVAIGALWLRNGFEEHASVASFARFLLQAMQLGGPPDILRRTNAAIGDEIRHAELCFSLSECFTGRAEGPGPFRAEIAGAEPVTKRDIIAATIGEACIGETLAVEYARSAIQTCIDPQIRTVLREIVEDEERHAELAWDFVNWVLDSSPELLPFVEKCFADAFEMLERAVVPSNMDEGWCPAAARFGFVSPERQAAIRAEMMAGTLRNRIGILLGKHMGRNTSSRLDVAKTNSAHVVFDQALAYRGMDRHVLYDALKQELRDEPFIVAFAYGSLVDGVGNSRSDVDIAVVTAGNGGIDPRNNRSFHIGDTPCDIIRLPEERVREIVALMLSLNVGSIRSAALELSYPERRMLHALLTGIELGDDACLAKWRGFDRSALCRHLIMNARYWIANMQVDLSGMLADGDFESMIFVSQNLLMHAADVLLAHAGETNPNSKWRCALLRRQTAKASRIFPQVGSRHVADFFLDAHRAPATINQKSALGHAIVATTIARQTLLHAALPPTSLGLDESLHAVTTPLPAMQLDSWLEIVDEGYAFLRLESGRPALILPERLARTVRYFTDSGGLAVAAEDVTMLADTARLLAEHDLLYPSV